MKYIPHIERLYKEKKQNMEISLLAYSTKKILLSLCSILRTCIVSYV